MARETQFWAGLGALILILLFCPFSDASSTTMEWRADRTPINHIVVIYLENHTFDNLYGKFPGANGLDQPGAQVPQVDKNGVIYQT